MENESEHNLVTLESNHFTIMNLKSFFFRTGQEEDHSLS